MEEFLFILKKFCLDQVGSLLYQHVGDPDQQIVMQYLVLQYKSAVIRNKLLFNWKWKSWNRAGQIFIFPNSSSIFFLVQKYKNFSTLAFIFQLWEICKISNWCFTEGSRISASAIIFCRCQDFGTLEHLCLGTIIMKLIGQFSALPMPDVSPSQMHHAAWAIHEK